MVRERVGRNLARGRQDAERNGQIEAPGFLAQVRGRQVDGHLARRKFETGVLQRGAHAIARLAHLGLREPHQVDARQPAGDVDLDGHARRGDAG